MVEELHPAARRIDPRDAKLEALIGYIAEQSEGDRHFGLTKLNKMLWFIDLEAYRSLGETVSEQTYQKLPEGPAPRRMLPVLKRLKAEGKVAEREIERYGFKLRKVFAIELVEPSTFSAEAVAIIHTVITRYRNTNGTELSKLSHLYPGYDRIMMNDTMPLGRALIGSGPLTEQDLEIAADLQPVAAEYLAGQPT